MVRKVEIRDPNFFTPINGSLRVPQEEEFDDGRRNLKREYLGYIPVVYRFRKRQERLGLGFTFRIRLTKGHLIWVRGRVGRLTLSKITGRSLVSVGKID